MTYQYLSMRGSGKVIELRGDHSTMSQKHTRKAEDLVCPAGSLNT